MVYELGGKIVLVTGGAAGIGLSYVKELLQHGVQGVSVVDKDDVEGERAIKNITQEFGPNKAIFIKTDVTKLDQFEAAFKKTISIWNTIDIVINNAGICNDAEWELEINVNCNSQVRGTLLGLQYMGKDKGGQGGLIVNTASNLGLQPLASCPIYVATKHFIIGFSRSLGTPYHYNRTGVKILTICPGRTDTALVTEAPRFAFTTLSPDIGQLLVKEFSAAPGQPVENVAEGLITVISNGENGSLWLVEGNEPIYEITIPDRRTMRKS